MRIPRRAAAAAAALSLTLSVLTLLAPPSSANGNNGTVKLDGLDLNDGPGHSNQPNDPDETEPDNDPHLDCGLQLEFFNFDTGQKADITFTAHPPTGNNGVLLSQEKVTISDDGTGGANNDPDSVFNYDVETQFDLSQFTSVHDEHGWHVKLSLDLFNADGSPVPGGQKHKVFWIEPCGDDEEDQVGGFTVDKVVSGNDVPPADTQFGFTVSCKVGDEPFDLSPGVDGTSVSFTLVAGTTENNDVKTFSDIPDGAMCRVTETDDAGADSTSWMIDTSARLDDVDDNGDEFIRVSIHADTVKSVVVTNVFNRTVGTTGALTVAKAVSGNDVPGAATLFGFTVACANGTTPINLNGDAAGDALSISLAAGAVSAPVTGLPIGATCRITETEDRDADSRAWTVGGVVAGSRQFVDVTIASGTTVAVAVTNVFNETVIVVPSTGALSIDKLLDGNAAPVPGTQFTFRVECVNGTTAVDLNGAESGTALSVTVTVAQAAHVISGIPTGAVCSVTETDDGDATETSWMVNGVQTVADGSSVGALTIGNGTTAAVVATNVFDREVGGVVTPRPPVVTPPVQGPSVAPRPQGRPSVLGAVRTRQLPRSGGDALPLAEAGLGLLLLGVGLTLSSRRSATA